MRIATSLLFVVILYSPTAFAQKGWIAVDAPFANLNWFDVYFLTNDFGFVVGEQGRIKRTTNGGADWEFRQSGVTETLNAVHVVDQNLIFAAGYQGNLLKSTNGGDTWTKISIPGVVETLLDVWFFDEMEGYVTGAKALLMKTTDGGGSWAPQNSRFNSNNIWQIQAFDRNRITICGNGGNISRTTDGGTRWTSQNPPFTFELYSISFSDTSNGFCVGAGATILQTNNGGKDWVLQDPGFPLPALPFTTVEAPDRYHAYACGWNAMIIGRRDGTNWEVQEVPAELAGTHLTGISFPSPKVGYICGWNGTILKTVNAGTLPVEEIGPAADEFTLSPLYPNPVTGAGNVTARYSIPERTAVSITVFDVLGKKAIDIPGSMLESGAHTTGVSTQGLRPGLYTLRVATGTGVQSRQFAVRR